MIYIYIYIANPELPQLLCGFLRFLYLIFRWHLDKITQKPVTTTVHETRVATVNASELPSCALAWSMRCFCLPATNKYTLPSVWKLMKKDCTMSRKCFG